MAKIKISNALNVALHRYPKKDVGPSRVLEVRCPLTIGVANILQCRDMVFDPDGVARLFEGQVGLKAQITASDVTLGDNLSLYCNLVSKFKVGRPKSAKDDDRSLELTCKLHFGSKAKALDDFFDSINDSSYGLSIAPAQGSLVFGKPEEDEEEDDDQAQIEETKYDCAHCNAGIETTPNGDYHVVNGKRVICRHESARKIRATAKAKAAGE